MTSKVGEWPSKAMTSANFSARRSRSASPKRSLSSSIRGRSWGRKSRSEADPDPRRRRRRRRSREKTRHRRRQPWALLRWRMSLIGMCASATQVSFWCRRKREGEGLTAVQNLFTFWRKKWRFRGLFKDIPNYFWCGSPLRFKLGWVLWSEKLDNFLKISIPKLKIIWRNNFELFYHYYFIWKTQIHLNQKSEQSFSLSTWLWQTSACTQRTRRTLPTWIWPPSACTWRTHHIFNQNLGTCLQPEEAEHIANLPLATFCL